MIDGMRNWLRSNPEEVPHYQKHTISQSEKPGKVALRAPSGPVAGALASFLGCLRRIPLVGRALGDDKIIADLRKELNDKYNDEAFTKRTLKEAGVKNKLTPLTLEKMQLVLASEQRQQKANQELSRQMMAPYTNDLSALSDTSVHTDHAKLFIEKAFKHYCLTTPEYSKSGMLDTPHFQKATQDAAALYGDLLSAPGMTDSSLQDVLRDVMASETQAEKFIPLARCAVIQASNDIPDAVKPLLVLVAAETSVKEARDLCKELERAPHREKLATIMADVAKAQCDTKKKIALARSLAGIPQEKAAPVIAGVLGDLARYGVPGARLVNSQNPPWGALATAFGDMRVGNVEQRRNAIEQCAGWAVNLMKLDDVKELFVRFNDPKTKAGVIEGNSVGTWDRTIYRALTRAAADRLWKDEQRLDAKAFLEESSSPNWPRPT